MAYYNLGDDSAPTAPPLPRMAPLAAPERPGARADRPGLATSDATGDARRRSTPPRSPAATPPRCYGYGPDHFLLRSSWGTDWGDEGYARMSLDYTAQAVIESYGVMV